MGCLFWVSTSIILIRFLIRVYRANTSAAEPTALEKNFLAPFLRGTCILNLDHTINGWATGK